MTSKIVSLDLLPSIQQGKKYLTVLLDAYTQVHHSRMSPLWHARNHSHMILTTAGRKRHHVNRALPHRAATGRMRKQTILECIEKTIGFTNYQPRN